MRRKCRIGSGCIVLIPYCACRSNDNQDGCMSMLARSPCVSVLMTRQYTLIAKVTYCIRVRVVMVRNVNEFRRSDCKRTFHISMGPELF